MLLTLLANKQPTAALIVTLENATLNSASTVLGSVGILGSTLAPAIVNSELRRSFKSQTNVILADAVLASYGEATTNGAQLVVTLGNATLAATGKRKGGTIETAFRGKLATDTYLVSILGSRIYPVRTPDNPIYPCVTYQRLSTQREHNLEGAGNLSFSTFVIDIWTARNEGVGGFEHGTELSLEIRRVLDGFRGYFQGVDIQGILSENESQSWESEVEVYRITQNWLVIHRE